jgi:hypothetical protein
MGKEATEQCYFCRHWYSTQDMIWAEPENAYVCQTCFQKYWNI